MTAGSCGFNVRITNGLSRDMALPLVRQLAPSYMLVMNDPLFAQMCIDVGCAVIYRQSGDDPNENPLDRGITADDFVHQRLQQAPPGALIHLTNEIAASDPFLHPFTRRCMDVLTAAGRKAVIYNLSTNQGAAQWALCEANIAYAARHGHTIGLHLYFDDDISHYSGAWAWVDLLKKHGGNWCFTEVGYLRTIFDANHGWLGKLSQGQYADRVTAFLTDVTRRTGRNMPAMFYSLDDWPSGDEGRNSGTGLWRANLFAGALAALNRLYPVKEYPPVTTYPPGVNPQPKVVNNPHGVNLRAIPDAQGQLLLQMNQGQRVTLYEQPSVPADGYDWQRVTVNGLTGWSAMTISTIPSFVDPTGGVVTAADLDLLIADNLEIIQRSTALDRRLQALRKGVTPPANGGGF